MNRQELRTLRSQLLLVAGLFAGCIVAGVLMATQRGFFEEYLREEYAPLPAELKDLADAAASGEIDEARLQGLSQEQRLALYDDWMIRPNPPAGTPKTLVAAAGELYLARAERTLVCGNADQRKKALWFLELAGSSEAVPVLEKASRWAERRSLPELAAAIAETVDRLQRAPSAGEKRPIESSVPRRSSTPFAESDDV
ncbi:MAG: hypothetical protein ACYTG0_31930 [Planctomycetota bacterium]|jgi:hypothetical protein